MVPQSLLEFTPVPPPPRLRRRRAPLGCEAAVPPRLHALTPAPLYALRKARRSQALVVTAPPCLSLSCSSSWRTSSAGPELRRARGGRRRGVAHGQPSGGMFEGATEFRSRSERVADAGGLSAGEILELRTPGCGRRGDREAVPDLGCAGAGRGGPDPTPAEVRAALAPRPPRARWTSPNARRRRVAVEASVFILDAVFGASSRRVSAEEARGSNEAAEILRRISACFRQATKSKGVQSQPHPPAGPRVVPRGARPLLPEWTELWLRARGGARRRRAPHARVPDAVGRRARGVRGDRARGGGRGA